MAEPVFGEEAQREFSGTQLRYDSRETVNSKRSELSSNSEGTDASGSS